MEVVVFPQVYERYSTLLVEDAKVFIRGRVSLEEDKDGKLICDQIISFEDAQAARAANQPLFPQKLRRPGRQQPRRILRKRKWKWRCRWIPECRERLRTIPK